MTDRWSATRRTKEDRGEWRSGTWNVGLDMETEEKWEQSDVHPKPSQLVESGQNVGVHCGRDLLVSVGSSTSIEMLLNCSMSLLLGVGGGSGILFTFGVDDAHSLFVEDHGATLMFTSSGDNVFLPVLCSFRLVGFVSKSFITIFLNLFRVVCGNSQKLVQVENSKL